jgi:uncharacterized membrane protein YkoI
MAAISQASATRRYGGNMTQHPNRNYRRLAFRAGLVLPLLAGLIAADGLISDAHAGDPAKKERERAAIRAAVQRGQLLALPRIMTLAQERVPGEVIKTELEAEKGVLTYEVKILTSAGLVREVKLSARTGKILRIEDD